MGIDVACKGELLQPQDLLQEGRVKSGKICEREVLEVPDMVFAFAH